MSAPVVAQIHAGTGVVLLARLLGNAGATVTRSSIASISYEVWEVSLTYQQISALFGEVPERDAPTSPAFAPKRVVPPAPITVEDAIYDSLQQEGGWTVDEEGWNFRYELPDDTFGTLPISEYPNPRYYEIPVKFSPETGGVFGVRYVVRSGHFLAGAVPDAGEG